MPPPAKIALVPTSERPKRALALHTVENSHRINSRNCLLCCLATLTGSHSNVHS